MITLKAEALSKDFSNICVVQGLSGVDKHLE